jgi:hypothetical protein
MIHFTIDVILLMTAATAGFAIIRKKDPLYLRLFPYFLLFDFIVEYIGISKQQANQNNLAYYNFLAAVEFGFFTFFFSRTIPNDRIKKFLAKTVFVLPVVCLVNYFFIQGPFVFNTYTFMISSVVMIILATIYYYHSFNQEVAISRLREPSFWINTGILFFFVCTATVLGGVNYFAFSSMSVRLNFGMILRGVSAFFYFTLLIAFLCQINIQRSSSSL